MAHKGNQKVGAKPVNLERWIPVLHGRCDDANVEGRYSVQVPTVVVRALLITVERHKRRLKAAQGTLEYEDLERREIGEMNKRILRARDAKKGEGGE